MALFRAFRSIPRRAIWAALILLIASPARPAGFGFSEQGAKAMAMGGAFAGLADDASAIWYNPAGIANLDHYTIMVGDTPTTFTKGDFKGADPVPGAGDTASYHKTWFFPPNVYVVAPITQRLKFGFGTFSPFGLQSRWNDPGTYSGRFIAQNTSLKTIDFEPVLAVQIADGFSLAAGPVYRISWVELEKDQAAVDPFTQASVDVAHVRLKSETDHAWGWDAGALWKASPMFSIGASYRSKITVNYSGTANFIQRPSGDPAFDALVGAQLPTTATGKTELNFPAIAIVGVAVHPWNGGTVTADADWTEWSTYKSLDITFSDVKPSGTVPSIQRDTNWKDVWSYRFGVEQKFGAMAVRAGFVYDQSPQPTQEVGPILPDSNRRGYDLGLGYNTDRYGIDLAYQYLPFQERSTNGESQDGYNGTYKIIASQIGISFRVSF